MSEIDEIEISEKELEQAREFIKEFERQRERALGRMSFMFIVCCVCSLFAHAIVGPDGTNVIVRPDGMISEPEPDFMILPPRGEIHRTKK